MSSYVQENEHLKAKLKQGEENFELELEKYKSKIRDNEKIHEKTIKSLEI